MTVDDRLGRLERHLSEVLAGPRRLMRSLSKTTTGNPKMTTPETVADVLAEIRAFPEAAQTRALQTWVDRIESALAAGAEPVGYELRVIRDDNPNADWWTCDKELYEQVISTGHTFNTNVKAEARALYTHAPPAVPVESLGHDAEPDRDTGGRIVREAWVRWALTQPAAKPSWLVPYDELSEPDKEADRQIFEACANRLVSFNYPGSYMPPDSAELERMADTIGAMRVNGFDSQTAMWVVLRIRGLACRLANAPAVPVASVPDGWRDISTIPRDESRVELLSANGKTDIGNWYPISEPGFDLQDHLNTDNGEGNYTHWRPLATPENAP